MNYNKIIIKKTLNKWFQSSFDPENEEVIVEATVQIKKIVNPEKNNVHVRNLILIFCM